MTRTVVAPERDSDLIGLALADLDAGGSFESPGELDTAVVVLGGVVDVEADGESLGSAGGTLTTHDVERGKPAWRASARAASRERLWGGPTQSACAGLRPCAATGGPG
jgi:5-deoxy-D-glucuronate isomerase